MAIDPSIALGVKPVQIESPVNQLAQLLQVQSAQQQNQLGQMKLDEHRRGVERTNRLQAMLGSFAPDAKADDQVGALTRGGFLPEARSLAESSAKVAADKRAAEKAELESHLKKFEVAGQIMNGVKDQATWDRAREQTAQVFGQEAAAQMPAVYDPAQIEQRRMQALSVKDQLEQMWKQKGYDLDVQKAGEDARHNKAAEGLTAAGQAITVRGQNMSDARAREQIAQGKVPPGYRQNPDGSLVPIPGGPADPKNKAPTEFQGKSAAFGARAEQADKVLRELEGQYSPAGINGKNAVSDIWGIGGAIGNAWNSRLSDASQRADQAQRDFVNAVLRQESGAAIGAGEFDNAKKQYFPQPGDSAAVLKQKAENRQLAVQGLKSNAGHAAFSASQASVPAQPALPATNSKGWALHVDAGGNRAYVSPDGKHYEEVH